MKKAALLIALLFTILSCTTTSPFDGKKFGGLKGNVKSVKTTRYEGEEKFGEAVLGRLKSMVKTDFNNDGNEIKNTQYDSRGDLTSDVTNEYKGKEIYKSTFIFAEGATPHVVLFETGKGYRKNYEIDNPDDYTISTIDPDNKYHVLTKDEDGNLIFDQLFNDNNDLIEYKTYDDGEVYLTATYEYNDDGLLIRNKSIYTSESIIGKEITNEYKYLEFDDHGNWTKRKITIQYKDLSYPDTEIEVNEITYR